MRRFVVPLVLAACAAPSGSVPPAGCPCDRIALPAKPIVTHDGMRALLGRVAAATWPELAGLRLGLQPIDDLEYFRAWVELDTVGIDDGRARRYTIQYDPVVLSEPMPPDALAATLVHELAHVRDYVLLDSAGLVDLALWYAGEDPATSEALAAYERATDDEALARGCAEGLARSMEWIYARAADDPELLAQKRNNYYTPDEIRAWADEHGACPGR